MGSLQTLLSILSNENVNIEYMYGLSIDGEEASVVLKTSDIIKAESVLEKQGVKTLSAEDVSQLKC